LKGGKILSGLKIDRRLLKVERVIGETTVRESVEAEIVLPFKIEKIFEVIANVTDIETEIRDEGVLVTGLIDKQLFVVDRGDLVRHVPEEVAFRAFIDVKKAKPEMNELVKVRILTVDTELTGPDTVRQTIILEIFVKVTVTEQIEVVVDVKGKDIKVKKELLKVDHVVGEDTLQEAITRTVTLPITAKKIFRILPTVQDVVAEVKDGTVLVRGVVHKQIFLVDEGDLVRHASEDIPFTKAVDIPGAKQGNDVQVNVSVSLDEYELIDPPTPKLRQTVIIEAFVKVTETLQIEVVVDVSGKGIEAVKKLLKVESVVVDLLQRETIRETVMLPVEAIKIFEILGEVVNLEAEARKGQVSVRGTLHKQIFFVDRTNLVRHTREDIPFRLVKNAPGALPDMNVLVRARIIGDIVYRLLDEQGKKLEQTAVIEVFVKVTRTVQLEVVVDVKGAHPGPPKPPRPPGPPEPECLPHPKKYIVQKGDTMFFIAQRFGVTLEALIAANPQIRDPNLIFPGDVIFIPGHYPPHGRTYIVQKGDTMYLIAQKFGVSLEALIAANPQIRDPNLIFPGDVINIPGHCSPGHQPPGHHPPHGRTYTVQKGDTMYLIAQRFGVSLEALIAANPQIKDPNLIFPGDVINIPGHSHGHRPPHGRTYTVQKGDTMYLIAQKFGVTLKALIAANPQIKDPNLIFPGDVINIPS
jgi:spore coat assembly protein SafA